MTANRFQCRHSEVFASFGLEAKMRGLSLHRCFALGDRAFRRGVALRLRKSPCAVELRGVAGARLELCHRVAQITDGLEQLLREHRGVHTLTNFVPSVRTIGLPLSRACARLAAMTLTSSPFSGRSS